MISLPGWKKINLEGCIGFCYINNQNRAFRQGELHGQRLRGMGECDVFGSTASSVLAEERI